MMHPITPDSFYLVQMECLPIFQQLQLEEALLRADERNWCLINRGSTPAIVMGISGKAEQLIDSEELLKRPVPLIRRFSGGGTVFVDPDTIFITWICNTEQTATSCCPEKIHRWAEKRVCVAHPSFSMRLQENDYVIGEKKCGGNAQYLCKKRWLHHSSLLWDYDPEKMRYLKMPLKMPHYRQKRSHEEFLCRLKAHFPSPKEFCSGMLSRLQQEFTLLEMSFSDVWKITERPHRKATVQIG